MLSKLRNKFWDFVLKHQFFMLGVVFVMCVYIVIADIIKRRHG